MDIKTSLVTEIQKEIATIGEMEVGSETYKAAVDGVSKLIDRKIEMDKVEIDKKDKRLTREQEKWFKERSMKDEKIDRFIKNTLTAINIFGCFWLAVWGTRATFEFEKEGTVTTLLGKGHINRLLPKK